MHVEKRDERILFLKGEVKMTASHDVQKIHLFRYTILYNTNLVST